VSVIKINQGLDAADGLSVPMGTCKKVWIAFPPTPGNLSDLAKQEGRKAKIRRIGNRLEGDIIFETTSANAVYLPVGCIHAVFTTEGGFLNALDFITPDSVGTYPTLFRAEIERKNSSFLDSYLRFFQSSLEYALDGQQELQAVAAWLGAQNRALEFGDENPAWKEQSLNIWNAFLQTSVAQKMECPCKNSTKGDFVNHFRDTHLWAASEIKSSAGSRSRWSGSRSQSRNPGSKASKSKGPSNQKNARGKPSGSSRPKMPNAESMSQSRSPKNSRSSNPEIANDTIVVAGPVAALVAAPLVAPVAPPTKGGLRSREKRRRDEEEEPEEPAKRAPKKAKKA
jgi:hypothetical protein